MQASPRRLRIAYLLEDARQAWGGVEMVLREANALQARGHELTVYGRTPRPDWTEITCRYEHVAQFERATIAPQDLVVGTWFPTIEPARLAGRGRAVHYCQGFEGDSPETSEHQLWVDAAYDLEGVTRIVISPFLRERLRERFGIEAHLVPYGVREDLYVPGPALAPSTPLRIALVGPWNVAWKDIPTGVAAARLVHERTQDVQLVRVSQVPIGEEERAAWGTLPVEVHVAVPQREMPELYRSCSVFLGTSTGGAEGFFLPAMEAMACGVPVILSDIACFRHYAESTEHASFVPPGDAAAFAREIERYRDEPGLREARRAGGLEVARQHTFSRHVEAMEQVFDALVPAGTGLLELGHEPERSLEDRVLLGMQRARNELVQLALGPGLPLEGRIARLEQAIAVDPGHARAHYWRVHLLSESGQLDAALAGSRAALRVDPRSPCLHRQAGRLLARLGRNAEARDALVRAYELGQPGAAVCFELTHACARLGRWDEMAMWLERAGARRPFDAAAEQLFRQLQQMIASSGFAATRGS